MTSRFGLLVWPRPLSKVGVVDKQPNFAARKEVGAQLNSIRAAVGAGDGEGGLLRLDGKAYSIFMDWMFENLNRPERKKESAFSVHIAKYSALFVRLALTLHFMKHGADAARHEVDEDTAEAVRAFIDGYLEPHARRIYGLLGAHPARAGAVLIANWCRAKRITSFTVRDIRQRDWKEFKDKRDRELIIASINYLEGQGWVREEPKNPGPRGGRPTERFLVNPEAWKPSPSGV